MIQDFTVVIDSLKLSDQTIRMLQSVLMTDNQDATKANTDLHFEVCDALKNYHVRLFCRSRKVNVSTELVEYVRSLDGVQCCINDRLVVDEVPSAEDNTEADVAEETEMLPDD